MVSSWSTVFGFFLHDSMKVGPLKNLKKTNCDSVLAALRTLVVKISGESLLSISIINCLWIETVYIKVISGKFSVVIKFKKYETERKKVWAKRVHFVVNQYIPKCHTFFILRIDIIISSIFIFVHQFSFINQHIYIHVFHWFIDLMWPLCISLI